MEKKIEDLTNLNYGMLSVMESMIQDDKNPVHRGKYRLYQNLFMLELSNIVKADNTIKITRTKKNEDDSEIIQLFIPYTEASETNFEKKLQSSELNPSEIQQL